MGTTKPITCLPKHKFSLFRAKAINRKVSGSSWKTQIFSRKLETNNLRLIHFRDCERLKTVGQIKEVRLLLSGMDTIRPPTPKYTVIWEVEPVNINRLKELGEDVRLSDKDLTLKTAMLMGLTTIKRCCDLHILDVRFMASGSDKVIFQLNERSKNFKRKKKGNQNQ